MAAIKTYELKKKKKKIWIELCSWSQLSNMSLVLLQNPSQLHSSDSRSIYTPRSLAWATWVSLERDRILQVKERVSLGREVLKKRSCLGEPKYFELKKGSRLGVIGSIRSRLGENGGKRWSPLHKLSLRRGLSSLRREWQH